jgi:hypothetical protein
MEDFKDDFNFEDIEKMNLSTARNWVEALAVRSKRQKAEIKRLKAYIILLEENSLNFTKQRVEL